MHIHAWRRHINYGLKISLLEKEQVPSVTHFSPTKTHAGPIYSLKTSLGCKWPREKRHQPSVSWLENTLFEEQKLSTNTGFDAVAQTQRLFLWRYPPCSASSQASSRCEGQGSWWLHGGLPTVWSEGKKLCSSFCWLGYKKGAVLGTHRWCHRIFSLDYKPKLCLIRARESHPFSQKLHRVLTSSSDRCQKEKGEHPPGGIAAWPGALHLRGERMGPWWPPTDKANPGYSLRRHISQHGDRTSVASPSQAGTPRAWAGGQDTDQHQQWPGLLCSCQGGCCSQDVASQRASQSSGRESIRSRFSRAHPSRLQGLCTPSQIDPRCWTSWNALRGKRCIRSWQDSPFLLLERWGGWLCSKGCLGMPLWVREHVSATQKMGLLLCSRGLLVRVGIPLPWLTFQEKTVFIPTQRGCPSILPDSYSMLTNLYQQFLCIF